MSWRTPGILWINAIADKWILEIGPTVQLALRNSTIVRIARRNYIVPSAGVREVEERVSDVSDCLDGNIFDLKIAGIIGPIGVVQDDLFLAAHFGTWQ